MNAVDLTEITFFESSIVTNKLEKFNKACWEDSRVVETTAHIKLVIAVSFTE